MILTVTLNPALDKTLFVDRHAPQDTLRATRVLHIAGGKGINVSRALRALGEDSLALAPIGGHSGAHLAELAAAEGLNLFPVPIAGQSRTAITIQVAGSDRYWHYLEPGPELSPAEQAGLLRAFESALPRCHTVVLSGSLPAPSAAPVITEMVRLGKLAGVRVALDAFGAQLRSAMEAGPWMAKPNQEEWLNTWGDPLDTEESRFRALDRMAAWGIEVAVLSLGVGGALALTAGVRYRVLPPGIREVNDLGSGDSFVAGLCWATQRGYNPEESLAWAAACGAANAAVWDPGGIDRAEVERLRPLVQVVRV